MTPEERKEKIRERLRNPDPQVKEDPRMTIIPRELHSGDLQALEADPNYKVIRGKPEEKEST